MNNFTYNVGEIVLRKDECFWIFPSDYIKNSGYTVCSPWFRRFGEKWCLVKEPYSEFFPSSEGVLIVRRSTNSKCKYPFLLWRKTSSSLLKHNYTVQLSLTVGNGNDTIECNGFIDSDYGSKFEFSTEKKLFSKNRLVKLFFNIEKEEENSETVTEIRDGSLRTANEDKRKSEQNSAYKESSEDEGSSEDEMNSEEDNSEKKSTGSKAKGVKKLAQNLKQAFLDEQVTDTVLKVDSREFKVHRLILVARSPVFASMFQNDFAEKSSNSVDIPDCTAESFEVFLHYLYTGSADTISTNNVHNLYYAADKYHVGDLKEKCVKFIKNNLSVETICDIIVLSLRHGEKKLQKSATSFFCGNIKKILTTVQWQKYMAENPTQANELLIKAHGA